MNTGGIAERRIRRDDEYDHVGEPRALEQHDGDRMYRCDNPSDPNSRRHDCLPPEKAPPTTLFEQQAGDDDDISPDDVRQWQIGDCYLLASLAALASTPVGRQRIRCMIEENRVDGNLVSYT